MSAADRSAITQRAPSHDSLCEAGDPASAFIAFPLPSGRFCVGRTIHAGKEHTARGGQRVYTHFVLLSPEAAACFVWDAARIIAALRDSTNDEPFLKERSDLPQIDLKTQFAGGRPMPRDPAGVEVAIAAARAAYSGKAAVVVVPCETAVAAFDACIPASVRRGLAISFGLKFAPTRRLTTTFVVGAVANVERQIRGQQVVLIAPGLPGVAGDGPFGTWLDFARRWLSAGRGAEVRGLMDLVNDDHSPERLNRLSFLLTELEQAPAADPERLDRLSSRWLHTEVATQPEAGLIAEMKARLQVRAQALADEKAPIASAS